MPLTAEVMRQAFSLLAEIHKQQDWISTLLESHRGAPLCVPGCGKCTQTFHCFDIEAKYVSSHLPGIRKDVRKKLSTQLESWLLLKPQGSVMEEAAFNEVVTAPCPFMDENSRCMVYPWRPINCRAWGITRPAGQYCMRPMVEGESAGKRVFIEGSEVRKLQAMLENLLEFMKQQAPSLLFVGFLPGLVYKNLHSKIDPRFAGTKLSMGINSNGRTPWIITVKDANTKAYKGLKGGQ